MLFRSTGPWPQKKLQGKLDPYPIFLGYAKSEDKGMTWEADFSRPALAPALEYDEDKIFVIDDKRKKVPNYSNGCIEDPRIFEVEGQLYVTVACRMFPPGPYWLAPSLRDYVPEWAKTENNSFKRIATSNDSTTVLFKLDLNKLKNKEYEKAFVYVCPLTDAELGDNRDVFLFPNKMKINGKMQYVMMHRPDDPDKFESGKGIHKPSMFIAAAEKIKDFSTSKATNKLMAVGIFDWEEEKIGGSWPPIKISEQEWFISYHGKKLPELGYTQSFMIMKNKENNFPEITNRCPERLMYAQQDWELPDKFLCPCIFTTGGIVLGDTLLMSYGAADQKAGIASVNINELISFIRRYDASGNLL